MREFTVDDNSNMADPPLPFKLERELTLMPNEFRARLSASHRKTRKSASRRNNTFKERSSAKSHSSHPSSYNRQRYDDAVNKSNIFYEDESIKHLQQDELVSVSSHIGIREHMNTTPEMPEVNANVDPVYNVRTPVNLHVQDLMAPLEDWVSRDTIRERKYPVLPSISKKSASSSAHARSKSPSTTISQHSDHNTLNQLDYGRERMEEEADFFADFRINTSQVEETPRQNPLPPIKHGEGSPRPGEPKGNSYHVKVNQRSAGGKRRENLIMLQQ